MKENCKTTIGKKIIIYQLHLSNKLKKLHKASNTGILFDKKGNSMIVNL